jgi:two-component system NtrC family sensor kinase
MLKKFPFKNILEKGLYSLTGKLLLTIGSLMILGSLVFWYLLIKYQERELVGNAVKYGVSFTDVIKKSTRYGMLTFQSLLIQQTVEAISSAEGVIRIRIFNNKGKIIHASMKEEIGTFVDKNAPMCKACHYNPEKPAETLLSKEKWTITKGQEGYRILNIIDPVYNEPACYTSVCHVHPKEQKVLGIIESDLSLELLDKAVRKQGIVITAYVIGFIFAISLVLCTILWKLVSKPVTAIVEGMERVGSGDLDRTVKISTKDEMGILADAFNAMTIDLRAAREIMVNWTKALEEEVEKKTEEIRRTQSQLVHAEKLASLGRMAAGVAHEINNPLTGIVTFAHLMLKRTPPESQEREDIEVIIEQAERCSKIIKGLLGFARATAVEKGPTDINEVLNRSIQMVSGKADFHNIKFNITLDNTITPVTADSSQLQQVFLNMLVNAADAMEGRGMITVATRKVSEDGKPFVEVEFTDTGPGISRENMGKIFEPFFSTKPVGKGTGLGLAVSHGIIQEHKGKIVVDSELGHGASFFVRLPLNG